MWIVTYWNFSTESHLWLTKMQCITNCGTFSLPHCKEDPIYFCSPAYMYNNSPIKYILHQPVLTPVRTQSWLEHHRINKSVNELCWYLYLHNFHKSPSHHRSVEPTDKIHEKKTKADIDVHFNCDFTEVSLNPLNISASGPPEIHSGSECVWVSTTKLRLVCIVPCKDSLYLPPAVVTFPFLLARLNVDFFSFVFHNISYWAVILVPYLWTIGNNSPGSVCLCKGTCVVSDLIVHF